MRDDEFAGMSEVEIAETLTRNVFMNYFEGTDLIAGPRIKVHAYKVCLDWYDRGGGRWGEEVPVITRCLRCPTYREHAIRLMSRLFATKHMQLMEHNPRPL
jgi:hypothetical protein